MCLQSSIVEALLSLFPPGLKKRKRKDRKEKQILFRKKEIVMPMQNLNISCSLLDKPLADH